MKTHDCGGAFFFDRSHRYLAVSFSKRGDFFPRLFVPKQQQYIERSTMWGSEKKKKKKEKDKKTDPDTLLAGILESDETSKNAHVQESLSSSKESIPSTENEKNKTAKAHGLYEQLLQGDKSDDRSGTKPTGASRKEWEDHDFPGYGTYGVHTTRRKCPR